MEQILNYILVLLFLFSTGSMIGWVLELVFWFTNHIAFSFVTGFFYGIFVIDLVYSLNLINKIKAFAEENQASGRTMNELLLTASLLISFGGVLLFHRFGGKSGLHAWIAVCAILANIEVTMLVHAFGMDQTLGNTLFASSFLATDILSELYGKKEADKGVWTGIATTVLFIVFSLLWQFYIPAESDWASASVRTLFSNTPRILIASLIGYALSELLDVWLYHKLWDLTEKKTGSRDKLLWLRNNAATLISQLVNIVIFNFGAFWGIYSMSELLSITAACYVIYIFTSLLDTPFVYLARKLGKREA